MHVASSSPWWAVIPLAYLACSIAFFPITADDALIVVRYAQNFNAGHGLVFNVGERINALTSPLHALVFIVVGRLTEHYLGAYDLVAGLLVFGTLFGVARAHFNTHEQRAGFLALSLLSPFVIAWTYGGLETPLLLCICCAIASEVLSTSIDEGASLGRVFLLGALAVLTRYDSVLFVAPITGWLLYKNRHSRAVVIFAVLASTALATWFAYAYFYYGDLLPVSFYVKNPTDQTARSVVLGMVYEFSFVVLSLLIIPLIGWLLRGWGRPRTPLSSTSLALAVGLLLEMAYGVLAATKHMMYAYRLFVPYLPALWLFFKTTGVFEMRGRWVALVFVYQILLGMACYYLSANPNLTLLVLRQDISNQYFEGSTLGARYTAEFLSAVARNALAIQFHWLTHPEKSTRDPRLFVLNGGMLPFLIQPSYIYEGLISYRHSCRYDLPQSADYRQLVYAPSLSSDPKSVFGSERNEWELVDTEEIVAHGLQKTSLAVRTQVYFHPHPRPNLLPPRVDMPCLPGSNRAAGGK